MKISPGGRELAKGVIERYGMEERILTLSMSGNTETQIAQIVSEELPDDVSVSQPTISRFLKKVKTERAAKAGAVIDGYLEAELPADLQVLTDMKKVYLSFQKKILDVALGKVTPMKDDGFMAYDLKTLFAINDRLLELVKTTLKILGVDADGDVEARFDPVDLSKYEKDLEKLKEGSNDS